MEDSDTPFHDLPAYLKLKALAEALPLLGITEPSTCRISREPGGSTYYLCDDFNNFTNDQYQTIEAWLSARHPEASDNGSQIFEWIYEMCRLVGSDEDYCEFEFTFDPETADFQLQCRCEVRSMEPWWDVDQDDLIY